MLPPSTQIVNDFKSLADGKTLNWDLYLDPNNTFKLAYTLHVIECLIEMPTDKIVRIFLRVLLGALLTFVLELEKLVPLAKHNRQTTSDGLLHRHQEQNCKEGMSDSTSEFSMFLPTLRKTLSTLPKYTSTGLN